MFKGSSSHNMVHSDGGSQKHRPPIYCVSLRQSTELEHVAEVVELVDALDSKSSGFRAVGFDSCLRHHN